MRQARPQEHSHERFALSVILRSEDVAPPDAVGGDGGGRPCTARGHAGLGPIAERRRLTVDVDHEPVPGGGRPVGRVWAVTLRRGPRTVVVGSELSRPSAEHLARELEAILTRGPARGGAME